VNKLIRFFTISCLVLGGAALLAMDGAPAGADAGTPAVAQTDAAAQPEQRQSVTPLPRRADRVETVGPGHVSFAISKSGKWLDFSVRGSGRNLFDDAGIVVFARGAGGEVVTVTDTRGIGMREAPGIGALGVVQEGTRGGARYPSANPDDDGDGRIDEDPLDGIDNDGDGLIDEDFAAIGDEMIVAGCETSADSAPSVAEGQPVSGCTVSLRQECSAWSLAHIDEMVAIRLTVRNMGDAPLDGVRIGAVIGRQKDFELSTRVLPGAATDAFDRPLAAKAMLLDDGEWPALAAVFASESDGREEVSWLTGEARADRRLADVVTAAERPDALARPDRRLRDGATGEATTGNGSASPAAGSRGAIGQGAIGQGAYGISPVLGTLEPGGEATVYIALVAVTSEEQVDRAIEDAFRTLQGDEGHRMIPPPMSITRRNIWGSYRLRVPGDPTAGLLLTLTDPRAQRINPAEISRLEGLDLRSATRIELPSGDVTFEITGELPGDIASSERAVLSGRTSGGEMFNAILRPSGAEGEASVESARTYWNTGGKLEEALLSGSPNPFRDATTISYEVPSQIVDETGATIQFNGSVETSVKVYNVAGRLVSDLVETTHGPGRYEIQWSAQDEAGTEVASGVYYVKLQIGKRFVTKRLTQLK
jgi:hypothetical protein